LGERRLFGVAREGVATGAPSEKEGPMRITTIETIRLEEFPNLLWVHVGTDEGLIGLGETFYGPGAAEAHIHDVIAPYLLGQDPFCRLKSYLPSTDSPPADCATSCGTGISPVNYARGSFDRRADGAQELEIGR